MPGWCRRCWDRGALAENREFREVVASALQSARHQGDAEVGGDGDWTRIFAAGSSAMHLTDAGASEVTVREAIYTPAGLQYLLDHPTATVLWMVGVDRLQPLHGVSVFNLYNLMTGERRQAA